MVENKTQMIVHRIKKLAMKTEKLAMNSTNSDYKGIFEKIIISLENVIKFLEKKK
jgi:hypothetical protein